MQMQVKSLNQRGSKPIGTTLIQQFDLKRNIVAIRIFLRLFFCIGVIGRNEIINRFCPISVSAPRNNVGGRR